MDLLLVDLDDTLIQTTDFYHKNDFIVIDERIHEDTKELEYTMSFGKK